MNNVFITIITYSFVYIFFDEFNSKFLIIQKIKKKYNKKKTITNKMNYRKISII